VESFLAAELPFNVFEQAQQLARLERRFAVQHLVEESWLIGITPRRSLIERGGFQQPHLSGEQLTRRGEISSRCPRLLPKPMKPWACELFLLQCIKYIREQTKGSGLGAGVRILGYPDRAARPA